MERTFAELLFAGDGRGIYPALCGRVLDQGAGERAGNDRKRPDAAVLQNAEKAEGYAHRHVGNDNIHDDWALRKAYDK